MANIFCKELDGERFRVCMPFGPVTTTHSAHIAGKQPETTDTRIDGYVPIKPYLQEYRVRARFALALGWLWLADLSESNHDSAWMGGGVEGKGTQPRPSLLGTRPGGP